LRGFDLDLGNRPALVSAQVALEHKHVIAHRLLSLLCERVPALRAA
jgi:hypothetical protein